MDYPYIMKMHALSLVGIKTEARQLDCDSSQVSFYASKLITTLNCVFISYMPQTLSDLLANYNKNIVLLANADKNGFPALLHQVNLLNSYML